MSERDILIFKDDRNRAIHGDVVVLELFPHCLWRGRGQRLAASEERNQEDTGSQGPAMPTGKVWGPGMGYRA